MLGQALLCLWLRIEASELLLGQVVIFVIEFLQLCKDFLVLIYNANQLPLKRLTDESVRHDRLFNDRWRLYLDNRFSFLGILTR